MRISRCTTPGLLRGYVRVLVGNDGDIANILKWISLAMALAAAMFASGCMLGYWLYSRSTREIPTPRTTRSVCDASTQTETEGIQDKRAEAQLTLAPAARATRSDDTIYFTLAGSCYHLDRECNGLNFRRYELQARQMCKHCARRFGFSWP